MIDEAVETRCAHSVPASEACRYELKGVVYFVCRACCGYCASGGDRRFEEFAASARAAVAAYQPLSAEESAQAHGR